MSGLNINFYRNKLPEIEANIVMDNDINKLINVITKDNVNNIINDEHGLTALHIAIITHANNVIKYLIDIGADTSIENKTKLSPIELANRYNNKFYIDLICQ
jgi:ankyrin repeat protein